jgi:hypothetical protein
MTVFNSPYRKALIDSLHVLNEADHQIFGAALGILMSDEWKEISQAFEVGDTYDFHLSQLESSKDQNVLVLAKLVKTIQETIQTIQNLNSISDNEADLS